ncbi:MAG: glycosyltransferase family 2 protein [Candidatus Bathyarchaeia archaeon]
MTWSIAFRCFDHKNLQENLQLENFKVEIEGLLRFRAPEYVHLLDDLPDYMLLHLHASLEHWKRYLNKRLFLQKRFRRTKILEYFSFWNGYLTAGGKFPSSSIRINLPITKRRNIIKRTQKDRIFSVIPIGSDSFKIYHILCTTLSILEHDPRISKVYCIYDGVNPCKKLPSDFSKVETIFIKKRSGPAKARNRGLTAGFDKGYSDVLLIDSDVILTSFRLDQFISDYGACHMAMSCPLIVASAKTWFDNFHNITGTLNGRYLNSSDQKKLLFGTTSCMFVSHAVYDSGILFSPDYPEAAGEDIDFCLKILQAGLGINASDSVSVFHWYGYSENAACNLAIFKRRFERYGRGEWRVLLNHPYYHTLVNESYERSSLKNT